MSRVNSGWPVEPESWDWNNPIEKKIKINYEVQFSVKPMSQDEILKKNQLEKKHRKPYELINQTHDPTYKAKITL
jgi:hypothetical protein